MQAPSMIIFSIAACSMAISTHAETQTAEIHHLSSEKSNVDAQSPESFENPLQSVIAQHRKAIESQDQILQGFEEMHALSEVFSATPEPLREFEANVTMVRLMERLELYTLATRELTEVKSILCWNGANSPEIRTIWFKAKEDELGQSLKLVERKQDGFEVGEVELMEVASVTTRFHELSAQIAFCHFAASQE